MTGVRKLVIHGVFVIINSTVYFLVSLFRGALIVTTDQGCAPKAQSQQHKKQGERSVVHGQSLPLRVLIQHIRSRMAGTDRGELLALYPLPVLTYVQTRKEFHGSETDEPMTRAHCLTVDFPVPPAICRTQGSDHARSESQFQRTLNHRGTGPVELATTGIQHLDVFDDQ